MRDDEAQLAANDVVRFARRRRLLIAAAAVSVLIVGVLIAIPALNATRTPEAAAERYLAHIAAGEAAAANGMTTSGARHPSVLTEDMMSAAVELIDIGEVTLLDGMDDDVATFEVTYTLAEAEHSGRFRLTKGEPEWGVLTNWRVAHPLVETRTVLVNGPGQVSLGGVPLDLDSSIQSLRKQDVTAYPAVYPVEVQSKLFTPDTPTLGIGSEFTSGIWVTLFASDELTRIVQEQSDALLDACVSKVTVGSTDCPLTPDDDAWLVPVEWEILEYPKVQVVPGGARFTASGGSLGQTYTPVGAAEPVVTEKEWSYTARLEIDGDEVSISYGAENPL